MQATPVEALLAVLPHEGGTRYSVIFFQLLPPWSVDPSTIEG